MFQGIFTIFTSFFGFNLSLLFLEKILLFSFLRRFFFSYIFLNILWGRDNWLGVANDIRILANKIGIFYWALKAISIAFFWLLLGQLDEIVPISQIFCHFAIINIGTKIVINNTALTHQKIQHNRSLLFSCRSCYLHLRCILDSFSRSPWPATKDSQQPLPKQCRPAWTIYPHPMWALLEILSFDFSWCQPS